MSMRAGWTLTVAAIAIFLLLNRAAYKGYFQDDDLDTLGWARALPASEFLGYLITPRLSPTNFRPVGAFYYHALETAFGRTSVLSLIGLPSVKITSTIGARPGNSIRAASWRR